MVPKFFKFLVVFVILNCSGFCEGQDNICDGMKVMSKVENPEDCGSYYLCYTEGVPLLIVCAGDHEFNNRTGFCDLPENALCSMDQEPTTVLTTTLSTTTQNPAVPNCNELEVSWEPNPHSCSRYFLCFHGNPIERSCAPGLHFSPSQGLCMFPEQAQCTVSQICPAEDDVLNPKVFPDFEDCSKFHICFNGNSIERSCAEGLWWDAVYEWCTLPDIVQCDSNTINRPTPIPPSTPEVPSTTSTMLPTTTSTEPSTTTTSTEPSTTTTSTKPSTTTSSTKPPTTTSTVTTTTSDPNRFDCPAILNQVTLHPHSTNCELYFLCFRGVSYLMGCATGLIFDVNINECLDRSLATCILDLRSYYY